ncbi:NAD(P)/FAD-dependent oxidoreductase [Tropicimonas marinistellae]|uniref:NAD(P)/FAD-dependent oxidoreductase n=1 Tax=Tropicimonas marinistellae TaxID=1739787 RepID=UPI00082FFF34|nr:FAD-dependent oxidoreductase [Tropicimonas marinistellae]
MIAGALRDIVIVGAGQGGFQAAASLRQEGFTGSVTLIGTEADLPYQRPPLSKAFLKSGNADQLWLRRADFYEKNAITLVPDCRVNRIDRDNSTVYAGDRRFRYDHLILATGCRNARPPIQGLERALDLRTLSDARRLRTAAARARRCAVIGGGFIGLEFAAVAAGLGLDVIVAEQASRLMARAVSPEISARFADKHRGLNVDIRVGKSAAAIDDAGLHLADGSTVAADLVLLAAGVVPNAELAAEAGLIVENGIVVDEQLRTSDPNISALGDCAAFPMHDRGFRVRLESVQAATDHARHIARRLTKGDAGPYSAVPWFWSDQADWKLQIAGFAQPDDESEMLEDGSVLRFSGARLTAVETINAPKLHMKARRLFAETPAPTRAEALARLDVEERRRMAAGA